MSETRSTFEMGATAELSGDSDAPPAYSATQDPKPKSNISQFFNKLFGSSSRKKEDTIEKISKAS